MDKITVKEIEQPIRVAEEEDLFDIIAERTTDKAIDRLGIFRPFGRSAAEMRKAARRTLEKLKPHLPFGL